MYLNFDVIGRRVSLAMLAFAWVVTSAAAADWPYWRGPTFDGTTEATGRTDDWDTNGGEDSNVLWKRDDIGGPKTKMSPKNEPSLRGSESPNLASSPGLYGNAEVAELYLENVEVTANTEEP
ncbi:MAG: hypothetical protein CMM01_19525 [Rhodopirellula sp.]|nr:hypothetical protein [Rhodopirellula sp.]OUX49819.1 MAG: hypothetical protein CBE43_09470 [Rhodopirellula sp. TMED283]